MRNIPEKLKNSIIDVFPKDNTLAIIIFGSYGTDKQTLDIDIYIGWVPIRKVPITELAVKTEAQRKILDIDVDLKIVADNYTIALRKSVFEGDVIYESKDFRDYLNYFYFEDSDVIDILDWREMYSDKKDNQF